MAVATEARLAKRAAVRSWWADGVVAVIYLLAAVAVSFFIADGGLLTVKAFDWVGIVGRMLGLIAAVLMLSQVLLIARAPFIERVLGHDGSTALHARLGKAAIILMVVHAGLVVLGLAHASGKSPVAYGAELFTSQWYLATAQLGLGAFLIVFATSLVIVRKRWRYETWYLVHLLTYVAIALAVPHQFLEGSTFRDGGAAFWFWLALYVAAFGSLIAFRVARPLVRHRLHALTVAAVTTHADGSASIELAGKDVESLGAAPGQFFLWRFLDKERWSQSHPYSLSRVAPGAPVRLTVKPSGDGSAALVSVAVGTRVLAEGPFGVFTAHSRTKPGAVLIAAGIGVTPVRALLDDGDFASGPLDVVIRARSRAEAPLLDEVEARVAALGASLHLVEGARGAGWASAARPATLDALVPDVAERDVYICGPTAWANAVEADARAAGVPARQIHREKFGFHTEDT